MIENIGKPGEFNYQAVERVMRHDRGGRQGGGSPGDRGTGG